MIGYLEGRIMKKEAEKILLIVNHVGYEIMLPGFVMDALQTKKQGIILICISFTIKQSGSPNLF